MSRVARRGYAHPFRAGVITILFLVAFSVIGFTKDNPFSRPFHINAIVTDSSGIKSGSLVRIAGVDVGSVSKVERYDGGKTSKITMDINENGLPVHEDARVHVRPRLFLEGNFVMELSPGAPGSGRLEDGDTIPLTRTTRAVQLDELFSTLQGPEREDLQTVFIELGKALDDPNPSDGQALTKGQSAGESFNDTIKAMAESGTDVERLFRSLQGQERGDLAAAIRSFADATSPLADKADDLARMITELDTTVGVFADNQAAVRAGVEQFPVTLGTAQRELPLLRASLDPARRVALNLAGAMDQLPGFVDASGPFLDQTQALLSDEEAGGLVKTLVPITSGLAEAAPDLTSTLEDLDRLAVCTSDVLIPTSNQIIQDGSMTTNLSAYDEFLRGMVGLASSAQNFDANGGYARAATAQGSLFLTGKRSRGSSGDPVKNYFGSANSAPAPSRPAKPANTKMTGTSAPWRFDQACTAKYLPNLSAVPSGPADGTTGP